MPPPFPDLPAPTVSMALFADPDVEGAARLSLIIERATSQQIVELVNSVEVTVVAWRTRQLRGADDGGDGGEP